MNTPRRTPPGEPATSQGPGGSPVTGRPKAFDPALKHFSVGLRPEDPPFDDAADRLRWRQLQQRVMGHVLAVVAASPWRDHLVLRGSALMLTWFGAAARPPKDLDFVVVPLDLAISDARAQQMLAQLAGAVTTRPCPGVVLRSDDVEQDDIWTYDRVPGTRLVFRWTAPEVPWGSTQLDFVFGEALPIPPESLDISLGGSAAHLLTAPQSLSLAWKLLWLHSDMHPRGKDLYDAMLLAESTRMPPGLLDAVFALANDRPPNVLADFTRVDLEWVGFEQQNAATVEAWCRRLEAALRPQLIDLR